MQWILRYLEVSEEKFLKHILDDVCFYLRVCKLYITFV